MAAILLFPVFWLSITAVVTYFFYFVPSEVYVNGVPMQHAEFVTLLWPKIFLGIFWLIGIIMLIRGLQYLFVRRRRFAAHKEQQNISNSVIPGLELEIARSKPDKNARIIDQIENPDSAWG